MNVSDLLSLITEIVRFAPTLGAAGKDVLAAAAQIWAIVTADHAPSEAQLAEYDAALNAAHEALQNS